MKKPITTRMHGLLDYLVGGTLLLPYVMNYFTLSEDTQILTALGTATILFSLLTNYEYSAIRLIPMKLHLVFDTLCGLVLVALPFLFPLTHYYFYWPVILGVSELIVVALSSSKPFVVRQKDFNIIKD